MMAGRLSVWVTFITVALHCPAAGDNLKIVEGQGGDASIGREVDDLLSAPRRFDLRDLTASYLRNGDFETTSPGDIPAHWSVFREAFVDADPALARSGQYSVRSSFLYGWVQNMAIPVSPYQSFGISGYAMREFLDEKAGTRSVFFREDGSHIKDGNIYSPVDAPAGAYGEFWTTQEVPECASSMQLFLRGEFIQNWLRFDDLRLYTEQFSNGTTVTGEAWTLTGGALANGSELILPTDSQASQRVAIGLGNQSYFTWGRYTTADDTELIVREEWLPRSSAETTATTTTSHLLKAPSGTFLSDPGRMIAKPSGVGRVTFQAETSGIITLTDLRRGFAKVEPAVFTAGPASPDGSLKLTAAWPEHLTTGSIQILGVAGGGADVPSTVSLLGTSIRAEWDGGNSPSGAYVARFTLEAGDGEQVMIDRFFRVVREDDALPVVPEYLSSEFTRGIWMFANHGTSAQHTLKTFQLAKEDGFNFAIVLSAASKLADVRQAAEATEILYVLFVPEAINLFVEYTKRTWFSKADYLARIKALFAPVIGSPLFQGVYVVDEPVLPEYFDVLRRANLSIAQDGTLGLPFTVYLGDTDFQDLQHAQPAAGLVDVYPFNLGAGGDPTSSLLRHIPIENQKVREFAALGRDMWLLPQAFINRIHEDFYPVPQSMHTAQLGAAVLAGARGIMPFFYNSNGGTAEGMRVAGLEPTPKLEPYRQFNDLVTRIGPLLMQLNIPDLETSAPYPFAVSTATGPGDATYAFVLNADDATTRTLLLGLESQPAAPLYDIVGERDLPLQTAGAVRVELGPGQWALFDTGEGNRIISLEALPVDSPVVSTFDLPITHQFTVTRFNGDGQPVLGLDFSPGADAIAASVGRFAFEPAGPMVFHLGTTGTVTREDGPIVFPAERYGTTADDLFYVASPNVGVRLFQEGGFHDEPVASYEGYSGGAYDLIRDSGSQWISMYDFGVRQMQEGPEGLRSFAVGRANFGAYSDIFGPFEDGSITAIVNNFGVSNIKPGLLNEAQHFQMPMFGADRNAAMNSSRLLAVPRHQFGVGLVQLSPTGEPELLGVTATDTLDATAVAWVYESVLAVADGYRNIRFYDVAGGQTALIGTWRPPTLGESFMLSMSARVGRLAVGALDGTVIVVDTTPLRPESAALLDWQYLE